MHHHFVVYIKSMEVGELGKHIEYHRFIAGPTLNNSKKKKLNFFGNYHLMLLNFFGFFWNLSLYVVENVAKV